MLHFWVEKNIAGFSTYAAHTITTGVGGVSGGVIYAMSNQSVVVGSDIKLFRYYKEKYSNVFYIVKSYNEFINM